MGKRLLPQRVFPRGTRTKMVRFWVEEGEYNALMREALTIVPGGTSLSALVVDRVLGKDGRMTSVENQLLLATMFLVRDEMGRAAMALRDCDATDHALADALTDDLRALEKRMSTAMDGLAL